MPRYYFDVDDGALATVDDEGVELANSEQARGEALALLGALAKDALRSGTHEITVSVRNGSGRNQVLEARLVVAVKQAGD